METNINKYELNTGDVVLSTKGSIGIVLRSVGFRDSVVKWVRNKDGKEINKYRTLGMINDDLSFKFDYRDNRIVKVWRPSTYRELGDVDLTICNTNLVYEDCVKEVTMDEVEAKFGCKVKIKND